MTTDLHPAIVEINAQSDLNKKMVRSASAHWSGNLREGRGYLSTGSGVLDEAKFDFRSLNNSQSILTNPEELQAAALAGSFTMYIASALSKAGLHPAFLDTEARIFIRNGIIRSFHLSITGVVTRITAGAFYAIVKDAEKNCQISKMVQIPITSEAILSMKIPVPQYA